MGLFGNLFGGGSGPSTPTLPSGDFALDVEFLPFVRELLDEFVEKTNVIYRSIPNDTKPDVNKPWEVVPTVSTDYAVRMLFFQKNLDSKQVAKYIPDTEVGDGVTYGLMYDNGFAVKLKDVIRFANTEYVVNAFDYIRPVDKILLYIVEFGK